MENREIINEHETTNQKQRKFKDSPLFARTTFIIGIISFLFTGILMVISAYALGPPLLFIVLAASTLLAAVVGVIFGGLSFRKGKNIFGILGFIFNFILVAVLPWGIYMVSRLFSL